MSVAALAFAQTSIHLGYCSDEIPANHQSAVLSDAISARFRAAAVIPAARLKALAGAKVTKIRVGCPEGMTNWYVTLRTSLEGTAATKSVDLPTTVEGWNEAELKEPYVITGETDLVLYYAGTLPAGKGLVLGDKKNPNGFYINYASEWIDASALGWNALCLQAVVEVEGDVPANDLAVENIAFESAFAKIGEGTNATVRIANYGFADAPAPVLHYVAGAGEPAQMALEGTIAVGEYKEVNIQLPTASCTEGFNDVRCWIDSDDAVVENNELSKQLACYVNAYPRRTLIEHFTTLACVNCPYGDATLRAVVSGREDYVWVAHHVGYREDELTVQDSYNVSGINGVSSAPMAAFDRTVLPFSNGSSAPGGGIGYMNPSEGKAALLPCFNYCAETPAFVSVDINAAFDAATRTLTATVSGERNGLLNLFYPEANLTVQLVEDAVETIGKQTGSGSQIHDHVYRVSLTPSLGEPIEWQGDAYSQSFTAAVPETWNEGNLRVVAFVNRPYKNSDCTNIQVLNANDLRLSTLDGIDNISIDPSAASRREYFNLQGQRIAAPQKGIYIEKITTAEGTLCMKRVK